MLHVMLHEAGLKYRKAGRQGGYQSKPGRTSPKVFVGCRAVAGETA